jgi:exodeoxyribonuclease V gamma subunit
VEKAIMKVFVSNKLEKLSRCFAEQLNKPLENPLAEEIIVVQSAGMARWVLLELARRHGIAANYRFTFPKKYLEEIFQAFLPEYAPDLSFDEQVMTWKILDLLPRVIEDDVFLPLRHYLGDEGDLRKMYQLARKIASTFDQYLIFRPEMILGWEEGTIKDSREIWQSKLWKMIVAAQGSMHPARLRRLFLSAAKKRPFCKEVLPQRLSIFGISYLPPYYWEIFSFLSTHLPVYYYYLNPSQEFWADIRSPREIGVALEKSSSRLFNMDDELLHLESGNSLLASWGKQGRDFFRMMGDIPVEYADLFEEPDAKTLLSTIQSDICLLKEPDAEEAETRRPSEDDSIQIHSCHSPLREVETLHDVLLKLFEKDDRLTPQDILVMTPDIELYAPYIEAVFEAREPKIPYTITDRGHFSASVAAHGVMALLDLAASRFTAKDVLSVLDNAAISEKYGLTAADLELIRHWVSETHIKWGIDASHRQFYDLPPFEQNTWRQGLDRLLAGYAFDGRRQELFADILPYGEIESVQAETLGCFLNFWENVIRLRDILLAPHPLDDWCVILQNIYENFLPSSDVYRNELFALRQVVKRIEAEHRAAKFTGRIELVILKSYLQEALAGSTEGARFLAGGVSFCALLPMRSIPMAVICLMGMGNDAFPRRDRKIGFNIMETNPRAGDRLQRNDDRYLFLEALLAARDNLVISYVGRSATDNGAILPSVLVCELLDYIDKNYRGDHDRPLSEVFTSRHRLHAFSPAYFGEDKKLFSYSKQNYQAARAILDRKGEKELFAEAALPTIPESSGVLAISDLLLFYRNPSRYFLENRLYLRLPRTLPTEENGSEPFAIDSLSAYWIKQSLVESHLEGCGDEMVLRQKRAGGVLPVGGAGDYAFQLLNRQARNYAAILAQHLKGREPEKYHVDLQAGDCRLTGTLDNLYKNYRIQYRMARLKTNDYLSAWIFHLIQNAAPGEVYPKTSLLLGEDHCWKFGPVDNAQEMLEVFIRYYRLGRTKPLKFFVRASWEYAQTLWIRNKSYEEAIRSAKLAWLGDDSGRMAAEAQDAACKICYENVMPIDDEFEETAANLLKDLCMHLEKPE